ncbi:CCR4-NOT transcription complex subunit 3-like isoform X2 [Paramacrobiotus metropolitanus]|uniref:CCR4-NOT transcription complex subunit 3-like isoform X2 n=1 Tax=Paramacrobiotus metropolitanus TaxID=2943436 RepID=UPI0024460FEF|nr:CCR4-NOT transcription complex subunit 3-like isoform X2 [Paramacrobiotus metropolitanus]
MSDKRKLLAEVDRTLKKIQEGMEIFDEIWAKVQEAPTQSHKEKYEQDLKKEIKKLQRLRDQVKTWIASSNEIKDKDPLLKARRDIEMKMEKFKDVERETKTKVYSKVGLAQAAKMDVNQKRKLEARAILSSFIEKMNIDLEQFESEMEDLEAGARKKKLEKEKLEKVEFLKQIMESHRNHITKMEIMLRMLDNDSLDAEQVCGIADDIKFYLDKADEGQVEDVNYVYEGIELEETVPESPPGSPEPSVTSKDSDDTKKKRPSEDTTTPQPAKQTAKMSIPISSTVTPSKPVDVKNAVGISPPPKLSQSLPNPPAQPPLLQAYAAAAAKALPQPAVKPPPQIASPALAEEPESKKTEPERPAADSQASAASVTSPQDASSRRASIDPQIQTPVKPSTPLQFPLSASPRPMGASYASSISGSSAPSTPQPSPMKDPWKDMIRPPAKPPSTNGVPPPAAPTMNFTVQPVPPPVAPPSITPVSLTRSDPSAAFMSPMDTSVEEKLAPFSRGHSRNPSEDFDKTDISAAMRSSGLMETPTALHVPLITKAELESRISPMMAMAPLGPERATRDMLLQHNWLEQAFHNPPKPCDSERRKAFIPCVHCAIPPGWPRQPPMPLVCDMKFYGNLNSDALFFIFYYQEGSLAQILAAKTLKSKNWRFHKQLNAWFQRLDEPKVTTSEYERGNYKYWDLDSWSEKQKNDFTFEYRYLENVDLNRWPYV